LLEIGVSASIELARISRLTTKSQVT
jgi:hypothetical protein